MALTDIKVRSAKPQEKEYTLVDGDGMFLLVHPNGSKYWRFRFRFGVTQHSSSSANKLLFITISSSKALLTKLSVSFTSGYKALAH